ncbi:MAG: hypothetical protein NC223_08065 [Butyrivibrio sp.]|nr:hypothetical protein [Butyrivibrio sp.]
MKNTLRKIGFILFFILPCVCTACAETSATRTPTVRPEDISDELYFAYTDRNIIKQERIEEGVRYIEDEERLVAEAVREASAQMRERYKLDTGGLPDGRGCYISTVAVTSYNNNINMLNDGFTLYIFNEDTELAASAYVSDLNARSLKVKVSLLSDSDHIRAVCKAPDTEFIWFTVMGAHIEGELQYQRLLGEDNMIYEYNQYMEKGILRTDKCRAEGDAFHALPEEMRFSYKKLTDTSNLLWIDFED